ncbi:MAG TPA: tetratricopeptide repeat protein [Casimicrobiaceae bacterium]|nr:tetratricopeptide repeat protein [Casimicrobiaceae bacterium]
MRLLHGDIEAATRDAALLDNTSLAHANDRERRHVEALQAWLAGDRRQASRCYDDLLARYPLDIFALHVALALDFRIGSRKSLRDRVLRVLPHWHAGLMHYGYLLGMQAFGLEENGDYADAAALAHRSLAMIPDNAAAMHVIAHVFEMQGRAADGIRYLERTRPTWSTNPGFAVHIAWHLALFHVDRGSFGDALDVHDRMLRPTRSSPATALVDASALLWRLELRGADVGRRWGVVASAWRRQPLRRLRAFELIHAMVAFVGARRRRAASRVVELLRSDPATRAASEPDEIALAIPFCEALQAFAREDYRTAAEKIAAVREQTAHCGGSVAQCDLVHLTLLEAALRGRRARLAQALAAERSARRPMSLLSRWLFRRAGAMQGSG